MNLFTIGFTKKSARFFFESLNENDVKILIDVRLNNFSQLSGFAKKNDLLYFLKKLCSIDYMHLEELAPTKNMLSLYRSKKITWNQFEMEFLNLMEQRHIENIFDISCFDNACLLCSEDKPHYCHRRLVAEYIKNKKCVDLNIRHIT